MWVCVEIAFQAERHVSAKVLGPDGFEEQWGPCGWNPMGKGRERVVVAERGQRGAQGLLGHSGDLSFSLNKMRTMGEL